MGIEEKIESAHPGVIDALRRLNEERQRKPLPCGWNVIVRRVFGDQTTPGGGVLRASDKLWFGVVTQLGPDVDPEDREAMAPGRTVAFKAESGVAFSQQDQDYVILLSSEILLLL